MARNGRYAVSKKIADGGMAEIFLASSQGAEGFSRPVILKRVAPGLSADPKFRRMLVDEAHVAMTLSHGNIVTVLDLGHAAGRYFLVMELCDGWDLNYLLARADDAGFSLPFELALHIAAEVCRGLDYAHRKTRDGQPLGIVHRDISPQNILISDQGEVKITDFGIAKAMGRREDTKNGYIKGKIDFMSPEQALGREIDARSDLFSMGTVLYLMVTGERPFDAPSQMESLLKTQVADFRPPETLRPELPASIAAIIGKAMRKEVSERYQTAAEMMHAIEAVLRTEFQSPGQSGLKAWLDELSARDHAPTISRREGMSTDGEDELVLGDDKTLALDAVDARFDDKIFAAPAPLPLVTPDFSVVTEEPRRPSWFRRLVILTFVGAAFGAVWVSLPWYRREFLSEQGRSLIEAVKTQVAKPAAEAEAARSTVRITSDPLGAAVERKGEIVGSTPFVLTARVGTTHELVFTLDGYRGVSRRVTVSPDPTNMEVKLEPLVPDEPPAPTPPKKKNKKRR